MPAVPAPSHCPFATVPSNGSKVKCFPSCNAWDDVLGCLYLASAAAFSDTPQDSLLSHRYRLEPVIEEEYPRLLSYAKRFTGTTEDAADVAQETVRKAIEGASRTSPAMPIRPWLYRIARNLHIDTVRRKEHAVSPLSELATHISEHCLPGGGKIDHNEYDIIELRDAIRRTLERLPERYRHIIQLRCVEERSIKETAKILRLSVPATESLYRRARSRFISLFTAFQTEELLDGTEGGA